MKEHKTVLIAEDNLVNLKMLERLLSQDYSVICAQNGRDALNKLQENRNRISAVILDLVMPEMDGYDFLTEIAKDETYQNLPVIVATASSDGKSEIRALELGAWDFVTKPYQEKILKFRLKNAIARSQLSAFERIRYMAEYDSLTGIYNKDRFLRSTREMLNAHTEGQYVLVRFDVDRFQLINAFFGESGGDRLLCFIADELKKGEECTRFYTYGRMNADVFAFCCLSPEREILLRKLEELRKKIQSYNKDFEIVTTFGIYFIDNRSISVNEMLDRAALAAKSCKGNYVDTLVVYDAKMSEQIEQEQRIINEMGPALAGNQFCFYL